MTYRLAFNPTDSPVIINSDGQVIAGHDWAPTEQDNPEVQTAITDGRLVWPEITDGLAGDGSPAGTAQQHVDLLNADQQPIPDDHPATSKRRTPKEN